MKLRPIVILLALIVIIGLLAYQVEIAFSVTPSVGSTFTPLTQPTPQEIGSFDVLGYPIDKQQATRLKQTEEGRALLLPENGAVEVTEDLLTLGRRAFYGETFKNEIFLTDVVGVLDGPINIWSMTRAIASLGGKPTTNLQVPLDKDVTIGSRTFKAGTLLNTGLDVAAGLAIPLGIRPSIQHGKVRVGITCAMCHAAVDQKTGRILEGAPNNDINPGLVLAFATNSAAMFRHTSVNPLQIPPGDRTYIDATGNASRLPDIKTLEDAVDAQFLTWPPGNFDSTATLVNNPSQNPSSYTFDAWPYGWSGHSAIGWFHGLTTLNSNVHATNSDATTGADSSLPTLGIDKETYLGVILQNAANPAFRLPEGAKPAEFFHKNDPTPGEPALNEVIRMPGYPKGSPFMLDGLMANSPRFPVGKQLNAMSAWQNTLAPPPNFSTDSESVERGAAVFFRAGCVDCHSGRYFTNHDVIGQNEIGTQPSRAPTLAPIARSFIDPKTYPSSVYAPVPPNAPELPVPTEITPQKAQQLAFGINNQAGGYKVPSLIGMHVTAPYLHDGGVAAVAAAIEMDDLSDRFRVAKSDEIGMAGTLMRGILPDPAASLRVLVDRKLRDIAIANNRANPDLQLSNVDGSGHNYWVDPEAGFTTSEQTDLIEFLLSLDDKPEVIPTSLR